MALKSTIRKIMVFDRKGSCSDGKFEEKIKDAEK